MDTRIDIDANGHPSGMDYITLRQAVAIYPNRPHPATAWRHARIGVLGRNGQRIRLRHIRTGGQIFTTRNWVNQFFHALAAADTRHFDDRQQEHEIRTTANKGRAQSDDGRERAIRAAEDRLEAHGFTPMGRPRRGRTPPT